mmetsp:Transcript_2212/g.2868  ORF Transcript_2212/g.2868 Transcript_2212/m.2868 type:complete len:80 (-) Transcript_2212:89-328(-)
MANKGRLPQTQQYSLDKQWSHSNLDPESPEFLKKKSELISGRHKSLGTLPVSLFPSRNKSTSLLAAAKAAGTVPLSMFS